MLQEALYQLLIASPAIQAIVGTPATRADGSTGVFPVILPQGAPLPAIIYLVLAEHEIDSMDGRGKLRVARVQVSPFGEVYADAATCREAAKDLLVGFQGILGDGTQIDRVALLLANDAFEPVPKIYHTPFDVEIWYRNAE
jgi:hypothetical protein